MTDIKVEADMEPLPYDVRGDLHKTEQYLKQRVSDLNDFIRNHLGQDPFGLNIVRVTEEVCSECKERWETEDKEGKTFCAYCGAELE